MKKQNILVAILIVLSLLLSSCTSVKDENNDAGTDASAGLTAFVSTDVNGIAVDQSVFENHKLTMVNIWATFCSPCIVELPDLAKLNQEYSDKSFQVVGIVADAKEGDAAQLETAISIIEQTEAYFTHILASESLSEIKLRSVQYVPETIFVDAAGNQVGESYVGTKSHDAWVKIVEALLNEDE